jgi:hypothetical protein
MTTQTAVENTSEERQILLSEIYNSIISYSYESINTDSFRVSCSINFELDTSFIEDYEKLTEDEKEEVLNEQLNTYIDASIWRKLENYGLVNFEDGNGKVVDSITFGEYFNKYIVNHDFISCPTVSSRSCVEGENDEISYICIETENRDDEKVRNWFCANCGSKCERTDMDTFSSLYIGKTRQVEYSEYCASDILKPDYLDLVERNIILS